MSRSNWHELFPQEAARTLGVDPAVGLSAAEVVLRRHSVGANTLPVAPPPSLLGMLMAQLENLVSLLLLLAALISLLLGEVANALAILLATLLNAGVGLYMDVRAEQAMAILKAMAAPRARVRRDAQEAEIPASELVPGDVVLLEAGARVPADGRLIHGECSVDESMLTGESVPVCKLPPPFTTPTPALSERHNELFAGSMLAVGAGTMLVTATGLKTEMGRIGRLLSETPRESSLLSQRLDALGRYLIWSVSAVAGLIVTLGLFQGRPFMPLLETAIVLAIAAIPEGLPAVATLALAAGSHRLSKKGVQLRTLSALEALGAVTTLCLDKTGTLTENAMTVREIRVEGHCYEPSGHGWTPVGYFTERGERIDPQEHPRLIDALRVAQLCNDGTLERDESGWHIHGDPSDGALLVAAAKLGLDDPRLRLERLSTLPAGPGHPWMLAEYRLGSARMAFIKGAPEDVLNRCQWQLTARGQEPLNDEARMAWLAANREMAEGALRVFAVARKALDLHSKAAEGWEWLGLIGMADPPRPGVEAALAAAHRAGIRTLMITGDQPATALAIARQLHLAQGSAPIVAVGIAQLSGEVDVYARATPEGKLKLVQALEAAGEVAVMTGDGVNDAPALRAASVGVAMGLGADVAREAAAIVLTDEHLATLLDAIREGRQAFLNIQKALDFLLTCSVTTMLTIFLGSASDLPMPLLPLQILYLNLLTHTFPALGLALEPSEGSVLQTPPLPRNAPILPVARLGSILWHSLLMAVTTLFMGVWGMQQGGTAHGRTWVFALLATTLMLHTFSDRSPKAFGGWRLPFNPQLLGFVACAVALQLLAIYCPPLARLLDLPPPGLLDWISLLAAAVACTVAVEVSKLALPPSGRSF